jgi:hypothetical protein
MRELYKSEYFLVTLDDEQKIVHRVRTDQRYATIADVERTSEEVVRSLNTIERRRYALLVDVRFAPPRNDLAFEQTMARYQTRLYMGFRRVAVLAKTEAGRLQIARLLRGLLRQGHVFLDEQAALAYLLDPTQPDEDP